MANPVTDPLSGDADLSPWQPDADGADTNKPQNRDRISVVSETSIAGEFRNIKSEVRKFSLSPGWINYRGCTHTDYAPDDAGPVFVSASSFSLIGDWRSIAEVGRRVRTTVLDGTKEAATIKAVSYAGGLTTITLDADACGGGVDDLTDVEFSATAVGAATSNLALRPELIDVGGNPHFVLPVTQGGTGSIDGGIDAGAVTMGGDVTGPANAAAVEKLRGHTVLATSPDIYEVLGCLSSGIYGPTLLRFLLDIGKATAVDASTNVANKDMSKGYVRIPLGRSALDLTLFIAWIQAELPALTTVAVQSAAELSVTWADLPLVWSTDADSGEALDSPLICLVSSQHIAHEGAAAQNAWALVSLKSFSRTGATAYILNVGPQAMSGVQAPRVTFVAVGIGAHNQS